jgi:hypothetical protein
LETDRLKIVAGACPNLLREASLYRYSDDRTDRRPETPLDEHNHALDALRYLVSMIDHRQMGQFMPPRIEERVSDSFLETRVRLLSNARLRSSHQAFASRDRWHSH